MPGLMNYGSGLQQNTQTKQGFLQEEGGSPINVMSTITPDSLTNLMKKIGGGVGAGAAPPPGNASAGVGASPGGGVEKSGDTPVSEQKKLLGFNREGNEKMGRIFLPGLWKGIDSILK